MNNELNLPNNAYPLDVFVALSELQDDVVEAQAAAAAKEAELAELREQTAELFAERLRAEGADDEAVSAAKAMWAENPSLAAQAALGADIVEAANPYGCNQYKHKPGCPEAEGGASMEKLTTKQKYELFRGAWASAVDKNTGKKIRLQITSLQADAVARWGVVGEENGRIWVMNDGNKYYLEDRTLEDIVEAANPYGCNQYGEGWKQPHNGKQSWRPGNPANKKDEGDLDRDPDVNENGVDLKTGTTSKSRVNGAKKRHQEAQKLLRHFKNEVEKHDSESQEAKVWKSALVEAEKLALNISKATSVIIENPNGKMMRRAGEESFDELQKLRNLFHRTSLETKNKTADEKVESSRTLVEMLDEADAIEAANPYGCNQYGHKSGCPDGGANDEKQAKSGSPAKKSDSYPNKKTVSLQEQLEQARQEAIDLVRRGKAHTTAHSDALRKLKTLEAEAEKEKLQERIAKRKQEREEEKAREIAKQNRINEMKKMTPKERSAYAEGLGRERMQLEIEQAKLDRELEKAEKENGRIRDIMKRYQSWRTKYAEWKRKSDELNEATGLY